MAVKQNAADFSLEFPTAAKAVNESFYVDDGLVGADSIEGAISLQHQLQELFDHGGFTLRKWNCSSPAVLELIPEELKGTQSLCTLPDDGGYTKTLGVEWNTVMDHFRLKVAELPPIDSVTKRFLISDVAKTFDVLGWFSPCTIKMKILFQQLWEMKVSWDDEVPDPVRDAWLRWRSEMSMLTTKYIPRWNYDKRTSVASEQAYAAVVYLRMECTDGSTQVALVSSKTKVAPIKRLAIPRLELCGVQLLAQLLHHIRLVLDIPLNWSYAWTDSTIVLCWLVGSPKRFKTYVGNRVSNIVELIGPEHWRHVNGVDNPADCASRGLFPSELIDHNLWWEGPDWLKLPSSHWPAQSQVPESALVPEEEREVALVALVQSVEPLIPFDQFSSFSHLKRVTAWIMRFIKNCRKKASSESHLSVLELQKAEIYWLVLAQRQPFHERDGIHQERPSTPQIKSLDPSSPLPRSEDLIRVGGREQNSNRAYSTQHPIILHSRHPITRLIICSEHLRLLHAGPTLLSCSLNRHFHIIGGRKIIRSVTRACVTCRRHAAKRQSQMMGQVPTERVTPDLVFDRVGVDYAGPLQLKLGSTRKPVIVKSYVCVFVSLSVRAVHLELVSDLSTDAFIACLRQFISRRGKPTLIWSNHGTNFVGATSEIKELVKFLESKKAQGEISSFCSVQKYTMAIHPRTCTTFWWVMGGRCEKLQVTSTTSCR